MNNKKIMVGFYYIVEYPSMSLPYIIYIRNITHTNIEYKLFDYSDKEIKETIEIFKSKTKVIKNVGTNLSKIKNKELSNETY